MNINNFGPPDMGKFGNEPNPTQQESKYGIGLNNHNDYSTNSGGYWKKVWNAVLQIWENWWVPGGPTTGPGCGIGADFMISEEEIIL